MNKLNKFGGLMLLALSMIPTFALARTIGDIIKPAFDFFKFDLMPILISIAVILIIINIIRYIIHKNDGNNDSKKMGLQLAWSIGGLFIIVSIWGIIAVLQQTIFKNDRLSPPPVPEIPVNSMMIR